MKFIIVLMVAACLQASAGANAQRVTLKAKSISLEQVFLEIRKQTGYDFVAPAQLIREAPRLNLDLENVTLDEALNVCFRGTSLAYEIDSKIIIVKQKAGVTSATINEKPPVTTIETVRGRVTNEEGEPVVGATVMVKGTTNATATDADGRYELRSVDENAILVISSVSIEPMEIRVNGRAAINALVRIRVKELDAPIVVAYNTTTQRTNTGAVTVVKGEQVQTLPYRSVDKSLQGLVPGLQITGGTGAPGGGVSNMVLRGISTGTQPNAGSTVRNPLIVVDGIPVSQDPFNTSSGTVNAAVTNPIAQLNPSDIESISVLKDAAAIALYGSKASNGVILITTKRGKAGKTVFNFRHQTDIASRLMGKLNLLSQDEFLDLLFKTYKNTPRNPSPWTDALIRTDLYNRFPTIIKAPGDTSFYPATNWFDELYDRNAISVSNEFSMSGGNDRNIFYLNLEHTDQNGVVKNKGYQRSSARFNFEHRLGRALKLGVNTMFSYNIQDYDDQTESAGTFGFAPLSMLNPVRDLNGNYILRFTNPFVIANPAAALEYNINRHTSYRGLTKLYGELRLFNYFTLNAAVGTDFMLVETKEKLDPRLQGAGSGLNPGTGRIYERDTRRATIISTNSLRYDRVIGNDHLVNVLVAQEAQIFHNKSMFSEVRGNPATPPLPHYHELNSPGYSMYGTGGSKDKQTQLSLFGQTNYGYKRKYFLSASIRGDGSSRFGEDNLWGTFWSVGAGWVLTEESFLRKATSWLDYLKLRGSLGSAGSSAAVNALTRYDLLANYLSLNNPAYIINAPGNPGIQWERTFSWDVGLEATLFNDRISFTADFYSKKTSDLIYTVTLPSTSGFSTVLDNIGNINNRGVELSLAANIIRNRDFRWRLDANWSTNQNRLIKANVPLQTISGNLLGNEEGRNFNSFYMPVWAGVNPINGKPQWINRDGIPDTLYANSQKQFVGQPQPKGFGAITNTFYYRNFELSALLYYQYGNKIYRGDNSIGDGNAPSYINLDRKVLDYWQKPGDNAPNPRRYLGNTDGGGNISTRFLFNGDYIRLRNVTLAYNFSQRILDKLHLSRLRVYAQGHNLGIITNFPGKDPDNMNVGGTVGHAYPNQRSFSLGLNLSF